MAPRDGLGYAESMVDHPAPSTRLLDAEPVPAPAPCPAGAWDSGRGGGKLAPPRAGEAWPGDGEPAAPSPRLHPIHASAIAMAAGGVSDALLPMPMFAAGWQGVAVAVPLVGAAITLMRCGERELVACGARSDYDPPPMLVVTGPFAFRRNPMYAGTVLANLAVAFAMNALAILLTSTLLFAALRFGIVRREEADLARRFGPAWDDYRRRVPRW